MKLVVDWDGTCTVRDSLVAAVHDLGDPSVYEGRFQEKFGSYGEALAAEVHTLRVTEAEAADVGGRERRAARGLPRARRALPAADRLERPAAADPAGARARGCRARAALERRRGAARRLARASSATRACARSAATSASAARCRRAARSSSSATAGPTAARRSPATASSRAPVSPSTSTSSSSRSSRSRRWPTLLLRFPEPYDFELSTERFRVFGTDLANLLARRRAPPRRRRPRGARSRQRPGGVDVEPLDDETRAGRREAARRASSSSTPFYAWAADDPMLGPITVRLRGLPPAARARPVRVARHVDHGAAGLALARRSRCATRMIERFGERVGDAWAFPTRERIARRDRGRAVRGRLLAPQGRVRARPRAQRPRPRRARRARRRRGPRAHHGAARPRRLDGRVVPRAPPRAAARVAGRRPRAPQGGRRSLRCRCARARPAPRPVPEPVGALPADGGAARGGR